MAGNSYEDNLSLHAKLDVANPDIYYIILDGYAGNSCLKEVYNFDNSMFLEQLKNSGFCYAGESNSNYSSTFLSMASSLNMDYLQSLKKSLDENSRDRKEMEFLIKNNLVVKFLRNRGYKFIHFQSGHGATRENKNADIDYVSGTLSEFTIMWLKTSIMAPYLRRLGLTNNERYKILNTFNTLPQVKNIKGPKFIFAHIILPHPPFLFNQNGEDISDAKIELAGKVWLQKEKYINQVIFANKKLIQLLDALLSDKSYKPVIIFQGDHGPASKLEQNNSWDSPDDNMIRERMSILNAYYIGSLKIDKFTSNVTPVNSFRIIFNTVFGADYPVLPDKNYYSGYDNPYKFNDVTSIVHH